MNKKVLLSIIAVCFILAGCTNTEITQSSRKTASSVTITEGIAPSETTTAASATIDNNSTPEEKLKSVLLKYTSDQIAFIESFTIGDNQNAAFAIAGSDVWFITDTNALKLKSNIMYLADNPSYAPYLWTVDDTIIFKCEEVPGGSSTISYAWYVKDGKPIELPNTGMGLYYLGNGEFTTIGEDFDLNFTDGIGAGHTYKPYYLYWTNDGLKEYGGLKITQQQLLKVKGAQAIIDAITKSDNTIDEIYYRANNIININYHSGDRQNGDFENVTLAYKNNTVTPILAYIDSISSKTESFNEKNLNNYSYGGIYQAAFFSKIVIYPENFR